MLVVGDKENTFGDAKLREVAQWVEHNSSSGKAFVVKEISKEGKHHIHCLLHLRTGIDSFRKKLKSRFPWLVRGTYGICPEKGRHFPNKEDVEALKRYCCKGANSRELPDVWINTHDYVENVEAYRDAYWNHYKVVDISNSTIVSFPEKKRVRQPTVVERVYNELVDNDNCQDLSPTSKSIVLKTTCRHLGKMAKTLDPTIVRRICMGVHNCLRTDDVQQEMMRIVYPDIESYGF